MTGTIDSVKIFDSALTAQQVRGGGSSGGSSEALFVAGPSGGDYDDADHDNNVCYFRGFGWRGWCEGGPNTEPPGEHAVSLDECWEKCASVYVDLVSVDYWPNGIEAYPGVGPCWCQTSCTHITFAGVTESQYPELAIVSGTIPADSCLLYTSPSPRDATLSRMPSSA